MVPSSSSPRYEAEAGSRNVASVCAALAQRQGSCRGPPAAASCTQRGGARCSGTQSTPGAQEGCFHIPGLPCFWKRTENAVGKVKLLLRKEMSSTVVIPGLHEKYSKRNPLGLPTQQKPSASCTFGRISRVCKYFTLLNMQKSSGLLIETAGKLDIRTVVKW